MAAMRFEQVLRFILAKKFGVRGTFIQSYLENVLSFYLLVTNSYLISIFSVSNSP